MLGCWQAAVDEPGKMRANPSTRATTRPRHEHFRGTLQRGVSTTAKGRTRSRKEGRRLAIGSAALSSEAFDRSARLRVWRRQNFGRQSEYVGWVAWTVTIAAEGHAERDRGPLTVAKLLHLPVPHSSGNVHPFCGLLPFAADPPPPPSDGVAFSAPSADVVTMLHRFLFPRVKQSLRAIAAAVKPHADRSRLHITYQPGDLVFWDRRSTQSLQNKLDPLWMIPLG